jgi:hypothetical protein
MLAGNVTIFIADRGKVILCEKCFRIAAYNNNDVIHRAIIGKPEIRSNLLSNTQKSSLEDEFGHANARYRAYASFW